MENTKFHTYKIGMGAWIQRMYLACKNKQIKIALFMYRKKSQITTRYENNIHLLHILIKLHFTDL